MRSSRSWAWSPIAFLVAAAVAAADVRLLFDAHVLPIDAGGEHLAHGDVDGDGIPDLVGASDPADAQLDVALGVGDGTYELTTLVLPGMIFALRLVDVDGDGDDDLVVADANVRTHLAVGDGTFGPPIVSPTTQLSTALEIAYVDGDDIVDVLTHNSFAGVRVLLGEGDGSFAEVATVTVGLLPSLRFADATGDGIVDIVGSVFLPARVAVRPGLGDGQFGAEIVTPLESYLTIHDADDLDEDGTIDLAGLEAGTPVVLFGLGDGTFAPPTVVDPTLLGATAPRFLDIGQDGHLDLVVDLSDEDDVAIYDGAFGPQRRLGLHGPVHDQYDVDGDGVDDLVLETPVTTLFGPPGSGYSAVTDSYTMPVVADLDGDGFPDIVQTPEPGEFRVHPGSASGAFGTPIVHTQSIRDVVDFDAGDFDGDGDVDLVFLGSFGPWLGPGVDFRINDGTGGFSSAGKHAVLTGPVDVDVGDVDGDGRDDAIVTSTHAGQLVIYYGQPFDGPQVGPSPPPLAWPGETLPIDLDADGDDDLVVALDEALTILSSEPGGVFEISQILEGFFVDVLLPADLDEDGNVDLISRGLTTSLWYRGVGDGTVLAGVPIAPCLAVADLDLDGHIDRIGRDETSFVSFGEGDGTFGEPVAFRGLGTVVADVDADDDIDVVGWEIGESLDVLGVSLNRASDAWSTIGEGLAGTGGLVPALSGIGLPCVGETARLRLVDGLPNGIAALFVGTEVLGAPFKGGTLVPAPAILVVPILLDAQGAFAHEEPWPPGASGLMLVAQMWIGDPGGPQGFSSSAGLAVDVP